LQPNELPGSDHVDVRIFWGKAGPAKKDEVTVPHPLICHMIDTAFVAEQLYDVLLGPSVKAELAQAFAPLGADPRRWVSLLCGLHDLGKASPAFQALRSDIAAEVLPEPAASAVTRLHGIRAGIKMVRTDTPHGLLTAHHLRRLLKSWGADGKIALLIAQALGGHHGRFFPGDMLRNVRSARPDNGGPRWEPWVEDLLCRTAELLGLPDPRTARWSEVRLDPAIAMMLAGLTIVSDWIASGSVPKGSYAGIGVDLDRYLSESQARARTAIVEKLAWTAWSPPPELRFAQLFDAEPRPFQREVEQLIIDQRAPGILVIEAPTGEGKTKSALQCTASLIRALDLAGFYVAMPTQATSNQMYDEVEGLLQRLAPELSTMLLHGTAAEYLDERRTARQQDEPVIPDEVGSDEEDGEQDAEVRKWFTVRKGLLAPRAVGTIDQALWSAIRSKWAAMPMTGLSNRVVILDEVHGYQVYMSTLLDRLLMWLGRLGVPVILLSATLPTVRRQQMIECWYAGARRVSPSEVHLDLPTEGYPRAFWVSAEGTVRSIRAQASEINSDRLIKLTTRTDAELVDWAIGEANQGRGVAIIHNLVRRVAETNDSLSAKLRSLPEDQRPELRALTARLSRGDRAKVEAELKRRFGRRGARAPAQGFIIVSTQILEQSLDLDFDAMASDLAPIDAMIQRAGRLHRFRRIDHGNPPTLVISGVAEGRTGPKFARYTDLVYDKAVLLRTWALLRERTELRLPDDAPALVDAVYSTPDLINYPAGWRDSWQKSLAKLKRDLDNDAAKASSRYLPMPNDEDSLTQSTKHLRSRQARPPTPWSQG
jgi:CRISPR-associated endonuclease/helicase Cas3